MNHWINKLFWLLLQNHYLKNNLSTLPTSTTNSFVTQPCKWFCARWMLRHTRPVPKVFMSVDKFSFSGTSPREGHVRWALLLLPLFIVSVPLCNKLYIHCYLSSVTEMSLSAELHCPRSCFWDDAVVAQGTRRGSSGSHQSSAIPLL